MSAFQADERGTGSARRHPRTTPALPACCHANGTSGSRRTGRATCRDLGVRCAAAGRHPDRGTVRAFRRRSAEAAGEAFSRALPVAREMGPPEAGAAGVDGARPRANASKRSGLRRDRAVALRERLRGGTGDLLGEAQRADARDAPDPQGLPEEPGRRDAQAAAGAGGSRLVPGSRAGPCAGDRGGPAADADPAPGAPGSPDRALADNGCAAGAEVAEPGWGPWRRPGRRAGGARTASGRRRRRGRPGSRRRIGPGACGRGWRPTKAGRAGACGNRRWSRCPGSPGGHGIPAVLAARLGEGGGGVGLGGAGLRLQAIEQPEAGVTGLQGALFPAFRCPASHQTAHGAPWRRLARLPVFAHRIELPGRAPHRGRARPVIASANPEARQAASTVL